MYPKSKCHDFELKKTIIKRGASIGANCTIIPGITIGENSLIGAGTTVVKSIEANVIIKEKIVYQQREYFR